MALRLAVYSFRQNSAIPQECFLLRKRKPNSNKKRIVTFVTNSGQNRANFIKKPADYPQIV